MCGDPNQRGEKSERNSDTARDEEIGSQPGQEHLEIELEAPTVDSPAPDEIAVLYGLCVEYVSRAIALPLDFSDETLPILDHYVSLARESIANRPEVAPVISRAIGAYFGELVRRRINGYWLIPNPDVHSWRVCARTVFLSLNPIGVACEVLAQGDDHVGPSGALHLAPEDQAIVADRLSMAPPVPAGEYYLLSTRLEAIDFVVETLRLAMERGGHASVEFETEDYE
jgi:hypothetical protein